MKEKFKSGSTKNDVLFALLIALMLGILAFSLFGCSSNKTNETTGITAQDSSIVYYCPMHPEVMQNYPGKCPKPECKGMDLMIKTADTLLEKVLKPVNASVLASVKTTKPVYQKMPMDVQVNGYIDYDDRTKNNISSLISGRIEKLYVKYNYQTVKKGQVVFEIYSPELVAAQENLLYLINNDPEEKALIESARQKLKLLGVTNNFLDDLIKTRKVMRTVPIYSKYEGQVYELKDKKSTEMNSMTSSENNNSSTGQQPSIKEGQYIMMGETVFNIVNYENLAIVLQIKSEDIAKVNKGAEAEVEVEGGMTMMGKIDFIEPILKSGSKTMTAKIYFINTKHNHRVGTLVKAKVKGEEFETLWMPLSAVMDLGKEKIVWVRKNGNFIAKKVETGIRSGNMIEIADGLTEESEIAIEAHYLTDSEGFINTSYDEN